MIPRTHMIKQIKLRAVLLMVKIVDRWTFTVRVKTVLKRLVEDNPMASMIR